MSDFVEVSYTGDILAHRRCARAWAYEKYAGFYPYEQVQAMEGRLIHHAMEWLTRYYRDQHGHASRDMLEAQLKKHFRVLWSRGIKTAFVKKEQTIGRILDNLCSGDDLSPIVRSVIEGAVHTEYELRAVRKILPGEIEGKSKILLTGVLDVVIQQTNPLVYCRKWEWESRVELTGKPISATVVAKPDDVEIWDYKGTRAKTAYVGDYIRQLLTYAALYKDRTGTLPVRCVIFFVNEPDESEKLLCVEVDDEIIGSALAWTHEQVKALRTSVKAFEDNPISLEGGEHEKNDSGEKISLELSKQCTACGFRFDCSSYHEYLGGPNKSDVDIYNVFKN